MAYFPYDFDGGWPDTSHIQIMNVHFTEPGNVLFETGDPSDLWAFDFYNDDNSLAYSLSASFAELTAAHTFPQRNGIQYYGVTVLSPGIDPSGLIKLTLLDAAADPTTDRTINYVGLHLGETCGGSIPNNCPYPLNINDYAQQGNLWLTEASAPASVPTPGTATLFATGLGLMALLGWRRRRGVTACR